MQSMEVDPPLHFFLLFLKFPGRAGAGQGGRGLLLFPPLDWFTCIPSHHHSHFSQSLSQFHASSLSCSQRSSLPVQSCCETLNENQEKSETNVFQKIPAGAWEEEVDTFIGQEVQKVGDVEEPKPGPSKNKMEKETAGMLPKGIVQFFQSSIGGAGGGDNDDGSGATEGVSNKTLTEENRRLRQELMTVRQDMERLQRRVDELQTEVAFSQDENSNLSSGLQQLDIQHQEAIDHVMELARSRELRIVELESQNMNLKREVERLSEELEGTVSLAEENSELRHKIMQLRHLDLPIITEQSAAEDHIRVLENEVSALRESRDNLESEMGQMEVSLRQKDALLQEAAASKSALEARLDKLQAVLSEREASLRQMDAEVERLQNEKKQKERDMCELVFETNALQEELKKQREGGREERDVEGVRREAEELRVQLTGTMGDLEAVRRELAETRGGGTVRERQSQEEMEEARRLAFEMENAFLKTQAELEEVKKQLKDKEKCFEEEQHNNEIELNSLRDVSRQFEISKDIMREKEAELKGQLNCVEAQLQEALKAEGDRKRELEEYKEKMERINKEKEDWKKQLEEMKEYRDKLGHLQTVFEEKEKENERYGVQVEELKEVVETLGKEKVAAEEELKTFQERLESLHQDLTEYRVNMEETKEMMKVKEEEVERLMKEKEEWSKERNELKENNKVVKEENVKLEKELSEVRSKVDQVLSEERLEEVRRQLEEEREKHGKEMKVLSEEKDQLLGKFETLRSQTSQLLETEKEHMSVKMMTLLEENRKLSEEIQSVKRELSQTKEEWSVEQAGCQSEVGRLRESLEEKERGVELLRQELDHIPLLKQQLEEARRHLQVKAEELSSLERSASSLKDQCNKSENLYRELLEKHEQLQAEKMDAEKRRIQEVDVLKKEVETLRSQLEYVAPLLKNVERQAGEGQPSGEMLQAQEFSKVAPLPTKEDSEDEIQKSQKLNAEAEAEISKLTSSLLKEQSENKLLKNKVEEVKERLEKTESQLGTLKSHLVEVEERYLGELVASEENLKQMQARLALAEERLRNSSTVYTSANIRANQQVEALTEQVRLLTEHKERMERQLSEAEDRSQRQDAALTRLQAVLHQFQRDKQNEIDFETERIRQHLEEVKRRNIDLSSEIKHLQDQLADAKQAFFANQKLSEQLMKQSDLVGQLRQQISDLTERLRVKTEKVNDLDADGGKIDRHLVKNLLIGYVNSPPNSKCQVLGALGQVLGLSKEERQKLGLDPSTQPHQSLSEAFIKFLEAESQPKPEVLLPLTVPHEPPRSRKSSLLSPEVPSLPHFPVGRSPGSILKDVLQDRKPE